MVVVIIVIVVVAVVVVKSWSASELYHLLANEIEQVI